MGEDRGDECSMDSESCRLHHKWRFGWNSEGVLAGDSFQHVNQNWACSQVESELEERDVTDCLMDGEMMRRWDVRKDEDEITVKK